ncbi:GAF and ANTAR domain-containing protein [Streptomyces sp. ODS28]|uniref:GAF and ANTAR domain-containing protein n=1 Tax=Streptomyces sp. ODS28 TaxID=3136688 RepID=UPI0031E7E942
MNTDHDVRVADAVLDLVHRPVGFDPLELLHDLTEYLAALLPIRAAGVTTMDEAGRVTYLTASDEMCRRLEQEQIDLDEGPCLDSARSKRPLPPTPLTREPGVAERWPRFAPRARAEGITVVAAVTLSAPETPLGAANLLMAGPPYVTDRDLRLARTLARATAVSFAHQRALHTREEVARQLQTALDSRLVIEQAKGVLSERLGITMDDAFTRLRSHARSRQRKLTELASHIAQRDIPAALHRSP